MRCALHPSLSPRSGGLTPSIPPRRLSDASLRELTVEEVFALALEDEDDLEPDLQAIKAELIAEEREAGGQAGAGAGGDASRAGSSVRAADRGDGDRDDGERQRARGRRPAPRMGADHTPAGSTDNSTSDEVSPATRSSAAQRRANRATLEEVDEAAELPGGRQERFAPRSGRSGQPTVSRKAGNRETAYRATADEVGRRRARPRNRRRSADLATQEDVEYERKRQEKLHRARHKRKRQPRDAGDDLASRPPTVLFHLWKNFIDAFGTNRVITHAPAAALALANLVLRLQFLRELWGEGGRTPTGEVSVLAQVALGALVLPMLVSAVLGAAAIKSRAPVAFKATLRRRSVIACLGLTIASFHAELTAALADGSIALFLSTFSFFFQDVPWLAIYTAQVTTVGWGMLATAMPLSVVVGGWKVRAGELAHGGVGGGRGCPL